MKGKTIICDIIRFVTVAAAVVILRLKYGIGLVGCLVIPGTLIVWSVLAYIERKNANRNQQVDISDEKIDARTRLSVA